MRSDEIRRSFLSFFEEKSHRVVASGSLIPADDPTLFFANAGMVQFKDVFVGRSSRDYTRATTSQKCLRVAGKHNDFETVGRSPRHHTFFEMLGNFSFGDYFKSEAAAFAWELLTERWKLDPDLLVATVHDDDDEAERVWTQEIGLSPSKVFRLGDEDNFWSMGPTGPCGPCSEIHLDRRENRDAPLTVEDFEEDRLFEIWNLVFMQFDRDADGNVNKLPKPSIDTGMGFERIVSVVQGVSSNYETDVFTPIFDELERRSGIKLERGLDEVKDETQVALRVVADHARAVSFLLADGVHPSNEGRGYVLRKILRRAAAHAAKIELPAPILADLTGVLVESMGDAYPELKREAGRIRAACEGEERAFEKTLKQGSEVLDKVLGELKEGGSGEVSGADAFKLHDTFGFPLEYTVERARDAGFGVDRAGFDTALEAQRDRSRGEEAEGAQAELPADLELAETEFLGYGATEADGCTVRALVSDGSSVDSLATGSEGWLVLDRTPFYAESGGQVGDTGRLSSGSGATLEVETTQGLLPGVSFHRVRVEEGSVAVGDSLDARVDAARRRRIMANHTATHLLHAALKEVLGEHVAQAGSLVEPDRLRFDFHHSQPVMADELRQIEDAVNQRVFAQLPVAKKTMPHAEAVAAGAVAMFGEKYGDVVRVVAVDDWSAELCGGTHCDRTEQIGSLSIVTERGVASGVRRIEAVTGPGLHERLQDDESLIAELEGALKAPRAELVTAIGKLRAQVKGLERELADAQKAAASGASASVGQKSQVGDVAVETRNLAELDMKALRELAEGQRQQAGLGALLLGSVKGGKVSIVLSLESGLAERLGGQPAKDLIQQLAGELQGGGGGRAELAWAGGKKTDGLDAALAAFPGLLEQRMASA
ncbi:MAG: alanine--tRNA ligase [Acidobacteriota bacterium]